MHARCSEWLPWEKFRRATSIPASRSRFKMRGSRDAGPIVQTILECRKLIRIAPPPFCAQHPQRRIVFFFLLEMERNDGNPRGGLLRTESFPLNAKPRIRWSAAPPGAHL